jgi:hypothetical protein
MQSHREPQEIAPKGVFWEANAASVKQDKEEETRVGEPYVYCHCLDKTPNRVHGMCGTSFILKLGFFST